MQHYAVVSTVNTGFPVAPGDNFRIASPYAGADNDLNSIRAGAKSGDCVIVYPGTYQLAATEQLLKDGVNWYFMPGAIVEKATGSIPIFHANTALSCIIGGYGQFKHLGTAEVLKMSAAATINFQALSVWQANTGTYAAIQQGSGSLFAHILDFLRSDGYDAYWISALTTKSHLRVQRIIARDNAIETFGPLSAWGDCVIEAASAETTGAAISTAGFIVPNDYQLIRIGSVKLTQNRPAAESSDQAVANGGVLDIGVISVPSGNTYSPISVEFGKLCIRNTTIYGPSGVAVVNLINTDILSLENVKLIGAGAVNCITAASAMRCQCINVSSNKAKHANVTVNDGAVEQVSVWSSFT